MTPDDISSTWFDTGQPARNPVNPMWSFGGRDARIRVIPVLRKKDQSDPNGLYIFCCIRGDENERTLSPMYLGPCRLYGDFTAKKMENACQYSKVYPRHVGTDGNPNAEYFRWARQGWALPRGMRYPFQIIGNVTGVGVCLRSVKLVPLHQKLVEVGMGNGARREWRKDLPLLR
jgi:hypothetical protein